MDEIKKEIALKRINRTIELAQQIGFDKLQTPIPEFSYEHILDMQKRAIDNFDKMSSEKLNRWLAWIQASVMSSGCVTLEQLKDINR